MAAPPDPPSPPWLETLLSIPARFRTGEKSIRDLFAEAAPELSDEDAFVKMVTERLRSEPSVVDSWQTYSYDKRGSPSPYMDGLEVGFYDAGRRDITRHVHLADACADFLFREAQWVLRRTK